MHESFHLRLQHELITEAPSDGSGMRMCPCPRPPKLSYQRLPPPPKPPHFGFVSVTPQSGIRSSPKLSSKPVELLQSQGSSVLNIPSFPISKAWVNSHLLSLLV